MRGDPNANAVQETITRARVFRDEISERALQRDCFVIVLDSQGLPFPTSSVTGEGPILEWQGEGRAELLRGVHRQAQDNGLELGPDVDIIEPPFATHRCRILRIPKTATAASRYITMWDTVEYPRTDAPEGAYKVAEFEGPSARILRATVRSFSRVLGVEIQGSWRESPAA